MNGRKVYGVFAVAVMGLMLLAAGVSSGAWSSAWKYNTGDLGGDNCLQEAADDLDSRVDVVEALAGVTTNADVSVGRLTTTGGVSCAALTSSGTRTSTGANIETPDTQSIPTNSTVAVSGKRYVNLTVTKCTTNLVAAPVAKGQQLTIISLVGGTNTCTFADGGILKLPGAKVLGDDDTLDLYSADGTNWWAVGGENN